MRLTKFKETIVDESDLIGAIYSGKNINFENVRLDSLEDCKKFNDAIKQNFDRLPTISVYQESELTQAEFDEQNQKQWLMPRDQVHENLVEMLYSMCETDEQTNRVSQELELFIQHNMMDLLFYLKYLVDTMRANNIVWGVGRGSSVASYVLYLIGVHRIDSIKYNLDIKEFLK